MNEPTTGTFGQDLDSVEYWEREAATYSADLGGARSAYHRGRLDTAAGLLAGAELPAGAEVLDFGCGDGVFTRELAASGYRAHGVDIADSMIAIANASVSGDGEAIQFGVATAGEIASIGKSFDALISLNVLAYLDEEEIEAFWDGARAVVKPGGWLLLSHSNELFDVFALNAGTVRFFEDNFTGGESVAGLLAGGEPTNPSYNVRANPQTYAQELQDRGFEEVKQAFFNYHPLPPALLGPGEEGRIVDPRVIETIDRWKLQYQCSTYFSLARRI